jgi:hypothetical protein
MGQRSSLPAAIAGTALLVAFLALSLGAAARPAGASALKASPSPSSSPLPSVQPPAEQQQPNGDGFLGTVASISGTVAAILGGFVLAALLSISSERNSMTELLKERERALEALNRQLDAKQQQRDLSLRELLLAWLRAVYKGDDSPDPGEVRRRIADLHLGTAGPGVSQAADDYMRSRMTADAAISSSLDDITAAGFPRSFNGWAARHSTEGIDLGLLRDAFDRAVDSIHRQERLAEGLQQRSLDSSLPASSAREADSLTAAEADIRLWSYGPDAAAVRGLEDEITRAGVMKAELSDKLATLRLPSHLGLGVVIFSFIVITGVIYPLCLMPSTAASFTPAVDLFIKSCLGLQMIAIVGYIVFVARNLRQS